MRHPSAENGFRPNMAKTGAKIPLFCPHVVTCAVSFGAVGAGIFGETMMRLKTGHAAWIIAAGFWASASLLSAGEAAAQTTAQEQPAAVGTATGVTATSDAPVRLHPKKSASKSRKAERQAKAKKPAKEETAKREAKADDLKPTQDDSMPPLSPMRMRSGPMTPNPPTPTTCPPRPEPC
ncbi:hypothetical protein RPMA_10505 [Tardiphaga alba]|uniref:Uncharacterized protein n=1 Tax=Tardiphaga alba TaxID=340268 RepID=A0ABX8AA09_9BRAD|nr:hypothetical protein [Tardiphaga alba]QUS39220.1 hypothetical protein RPMA_10505 [Tardiphaga alba]